MLTDTASNAEAPADGNPGSRRLARWWMLPLVLALLAFGVGRLSVGTWWRGETDLLGRRRYVPRFRVAPEALRSIPFDRVHEVLLPRYLMALQRAWQPSARREAVQALGPLREALRPDPNLLSLVDELDALASRDVRLHSARIRWLVWAWSAYLDAQHIPYRLEGSVRGVVGRSALYFRAYRVLSEQSVRVGNSSYRARWLRRSDRTNLREVDLGHTSDARDGALVLVDRVEDFAIDRVWPLLDPALDVYMDAGDRAHAASVRSEAEAALPPDILQLLRRTARPRFLLAETARSIDARAVCGSATRVGRLPLRGFTENSIANARAYAEQTVRGECPELLPEEVDTIAEASRTLRPEQELERGVEALLVWLLRAVTAHEVRHAADDAAHDGLRTAIPCVGCGTLSVSSRAEASAFLASFATPKVGRMALYQACLSARTGLGPHGVAFGFLQQRLGNNLCNAPPAQLYEQAQRLEQTLFSRAERIVLPTGQHTEVLFNER